MNKYFKLIILAFISIACLYVAFQGEDLNELKFHLGQTDLVGVCIAILLLVFSCIIRALRWQFLLNPFDTIQFKKVFGATMVGYFGNGILAFRLGELLKAYYVSKGRNLKVMQAFGTVIIERIMDIAASIQNVLNDAVLLMAKHAYEKTGIKNLVMSGGVALNVVSMGRISNAGIFDKLWIQPAAGDSGSALGAALWCWHNTLDANRIPCLPDSMKGSFLGPEIKLSDHRDDQFLKNYGAIWKDLSLQNERYTYLAKLRLFLA